MSLIQIEQERADLWKAEVEAVTGFGTAHRVMLHAPTFGEVREKIVEAYRTFVPLSAAEPVSVLNALEASEVGETETGDPVKRGPGRPRKNPSQ
jgi:hypothetical protein